MGLVTLSFVGCSSNGKEVLISNPTMIVENSVNKENNKGTIKDIGLMELDSL